MSAQTQLFDPDLLDAVPTIALFLALVLTALGVIAHAAFRLTPRQLHGPGPVDDRGSEPGPPFVGRAPGGRPPPGGPTSDVGGGRTANVAAESASRWIRDATLAEDHAGMDELNLQHREPAFRSFRICLDQPQRPATILGIVRRVAAEQAKTKSPVKQIPLPRRIGALRLRVSAGLSRPASADPLTRRLHHARY